jgi:hypothetical protein
LEKENLSEQKNLAMLSKKGLDYFRQIP